VRAAEASASAFITSTVDEADRVLLRQDTCASSKPQSINSNGTRYVIGHRNEGRVATHSCAFARTGAAPCRGDAEETASRRRPDPRLVCIPGPGAPARGISMPTRP